MCRQVTLTDVVRISEIDADGVPKMLIYILRSVLQYLISVVVDEGYVILKSQIHESETILHIWQCGYKVNLKNIQYYPI